MKLKVSLPTLRRDGSREEVASRCARAGPAPGPCPGRRGAVHLRRLALRRRQQQLPDQEPRPRGAAVVRHRLRQRHAQRQVLQRPNRRGHRGRQDGPAAPAGVPGPVRGRDRHLPERPQLRVRRRRHPQRDILPLHTEVLPVQADRAVPGDAGVHAGEGRAGGGGQAVRRGLLRGGHGRQRLHQQLPPPGLLRLLDIQRRELRQLHGYHPGSPAQAPARAGGAAAHLLRARPHGLHPAAAVPAEVVDGVPGLHQQAGPQLQQAGRGGDHAAVGVAAQRDVPVRGRVRLLPGHHQPAIHARLQQLPRPVLLAGEYQAHAHLHPALHALQGPQQVRVLGRIPPHRQGQRAHRARDAQEAQHHHRRQQYQQLVTPLAK